ncbi:MAG: type II toxin-antitoxin system HicB family antitoxin [Bacteroidales bacterium]
MKRIVVNIDWCEKNYSASSMDVLGCIATASTLESIKKEYISALEFHIEGCEPDELPKDIVNGNYEVEFVLSTQAILNHYKGQVTLNAIAKRSGINKTQLGHYSQGVRNARPQQRKKIIDAIHSLGRELISVE